ncbi:MAG: GTP 3',8-cyclase MoaA [Nitrososphaerales archaeon]
MNTALQRGENLHDSYDRLASKLRISITDRCNFRCSFCMPSHPVWLPHEEILTFEEIVRITRILGQMGIERVRLSGGEPLVRKDAESLVSMISKVNGIRSIGMTTNGALLAAKAQELKRAGLDSVTISLHSLNPERFDKITGTHGVFDKIAEGIDVARSLSFNPLKINCVITRGDNEDEIMDFANLAYETGVTVRFIEYMPFDGSKLWDVHRLISGNEIIQKVEEVYPLVKTDRETGSTASVYRFEDGSHGEIATITSMTAPFCGDCDRIRITANGKVVPCLFSNDEYDIKSIMRSGVSDEDLSDYIRNVYLKKSPGVETMMLKKLKLEHVRPMHTIGG